MGQEARARIILSPETNSKRFNDKVILIKSGETVNVSRSSSDEKPDTDNAVFDCRVLSRPQAVLSRQSGNFYIKDVGSSNGTFINNFRLNKPGAESEQTRIFSDDILRFGSEIECEGQKSKCIICKVKIFSADGEEHAKREISDRLYRPKSDFIANVSVKQVKFSDAAINQNVENQAVEKLEKMITERFLKEQDTLKDNISVLEKKLKRKQNENQNLIDNIEKLTKAELDRVSDIYDLKEALDMRDKECQKLSDELAVKTKEQIENIKVKDLQCELEDTKKVLKFTTDELWLLKEKLKVESAKVKRKNDFENNNIIGAAELQNLNKIITSQKEEIAELSALITKGDNIIKQKDNEIVNLRKSLEKDKAEMEGEVSSLRCLMTEENETVHQIQEEMSRLLKIIAQDQDELQMKDREIEQLTDDNNAIQEKLAAMEEIEERQREEIKQCKVDLDKQQELKLMIESYKAKVENSMQMIAEKSKEIETLQSADNSGLNLANNEVSTLKGQLTEKERHIDALENDVKQLTLELENERQVTLHVQFTQEKELMFKEREIYTLNTILTQERKVLLDKEEEIKKLRYNFENKNQNNSNSISTQPTPTRPPRTRSMFITTNMTIDAGLVANGNTDVTNNVKDCQDDNSDTVTFHDALNHQTTTEVVSSDEEDVLINDLEIDDFDDDRRPRVSDINFDQVSLG